MEAETGAEMAITDGRKISLFIETDGDDISAILPKNGDVDATRRSRVGSSENDEMSPISNQIKNWFISLTPQERSSATYCVDQAFISAFLSLSPPFSSSSEATSFIESTPWGTRMVKLAMFEKKYAAAKTSQERTPKCNNRKSAEIIHDVGETFDCAAAVVGESPLNDDTALRIPASVVVESDIAVHVPSGIGNELLEHTAVISPCVFEFSGSPIEQLNPVMIVLPSFFQEDGNSCTTFLFNDLESIADGPSWLHQLAASNGDTVSLGELIRARFSLAVQQSFVEAQNMVSVLPDSLEVVPAGGPPLHLTLSKVFEKCNELKAMHGNMEEKQKRMVFGQLLKELSIAAVPAELGIELVVQTPMPLLLSASRTKDVSLLALNNEAQLSLSILTAEKEKASTVDVVTEANILQVVPPKETSKKKKKRKNKRKGKKAAAAATAAATHQPIQLAVVQDVVDKVETDFKVETEPDAEIKSDTKVEIKMDVQEEILSFLDRNEKPSLAPPVVQVQDSSSVESSDGSIDLQRMGSGGNKESTTQHETSASTARFDRRMVVAPAAFSGSVSAGEKEAIGEPTGGGGDDWATVEVKRGSRKKATSPRQSQHNAFSEPQSNIAKKQRAVRNSLSGRAKKFNRKVVKEVLSLIVDQVVEEDARKPKPIIPSPPRVVNSWKNGPPGSTNQPKPSPPPPLSFAAALTKTSKQETPTSMRDVVAGSRNPSGSPAVMEKPLAQPPAPSGTERHDIQKKPTPTKRSKTASSPADQNTAPTYQETVSAMSATSAVPNEFKSSPSGTAFDRKSDSSAGLTDEPPPNLEPATTQEDHQATADATPPLPTLLSPENASSATSSVASSLEAPHSRHVHHHRSLTDANDVGYHLLDVCDRLSRDTSLFMSRRALALTIRRRERGALLAALQDSVTELWPTQCHVQLYGSCATQLDLPASDIDVVVVGFERMVSMDCSPAHGSTHASAASDNGGGPGSSEGASTDDCTQVMGPPPSQLNADRVVRLAAELESKPWAVQVRAIPRASVPVVKILADPSRLGQTSGSGEWMTRHQHLAAQAAAASGRGPVNTCSKDGEDEGSEQEPFQQSSLWRGSDVMKGLLSLDITFEGIEHGGVGSTEFSAAVVSHLSAEYGLHPDATPFVQVLMVLKELLAQRKLNEPYSGGLSSYALLLLLLALVREREVIRTEIERFEQQKVSMSSSEMNSYSASPGVGKEGGRGLASSAQPFSPAAFANSKETAKDRPVAKQRTSAPKGKGGTKKSTLSKDSTPKSSNPPPQTSSRNPSPSSWASIAKKMDVAAKEPSCTEFRSNVPQTPSTPPKLSFAEAAKLSQVDSTTSSRKSPSPSLANTKNTSNVTEPTQPDYATTAEPSSVAPPCFPQGYNDIVEVLCTGETTAGKLLMHFLLYYGQHFDAQTTTIDLRFDYPNQATDYTYFSPYIHRQAPGSIDPVTGMLTVDPIVVYDPLYRYDRNVARRCYAWTQVRWIFAQSYATLASAVERSKTPPTSPTVSPCPSAASTGSRVKVSSTNLYSPDDGLDLNDSSSSLLRCLLSF